MYNGVTCTPEHPTVTHLPTVRTAAAGRAVAVVGDVYRFLVTGEETGGKYAVCEALVPPGGGPPPHVHSREDEIIQVLEGEYEIQLGDQTYQVKAGGLLHFPRYIPHAFRNVGRESGTTLWTVIPGGNFEKFFEELGALPAGGPPDMAKVAAIFGSYGMEILPLPIQ